MKLIDLKDKYLKLTIKKNLKGNEALEAVKQNGNALRYVKEQTEQICLEAVKQNGDSLQFVKEQTEQICLEAVKQNGNALRYVKEQTEQICLEAVKQDGNALRYVYESFFENKTELLNPEEIKNKIFELVNKLIGVNNDN